jgi:hypothetical protein
MLVRGLRVLFGTAGVLPALAVIALAVMFGGGSMFLGSIFMMFGSLVMFVFGHEVLVGCQLPVSTNPPHTPTFQTIRSSSNAQGPPGRTSSTSAVPCVLRMMRNDPVLSHLGVTLTRDSVRGTMRGRLRNARASRGLNRERSDFFHEPW